MIVGVDFDNTVVSYDLAFRRAAIAAGLVGGDFSGGKHELREAVRSLEFGAERWTQLQAEVYGPRLADAGAFPGFVEFAELCESLSIALFLVSHKSEFAAADPGRVNLRDAARQWLRKRLPGRTFTGVFFEDDRSGKMRRIGELGCTHFVDDLAELFLEPAFPESTMRWLFDPSGTQPDVPDTERFDHWDRLSARLLEEHTTWSVAAQLTGSAVRRVTRTGAGGNNRVYRVEWKANVGALKLYGSSDERGRFEHETRALRFFGGRGFPVPGLLAADAQTGAALVEWVDGEPTREPQPGDVAAAIALIQALDRLRMSREADRIAEAAEAGLCVGSVWKQIGARRDRLNGCAPELAGYLSEFTRVFGAVRRRYEQSRDPSRVLDRGQATLSPSDFGLHNALRRGGSLVFLDFEYFGWDDPAKLTADFTLHPGMMLRPADTKEWLTGMLSLFGRDADFRARLEDCFPTYMLKWCLIVLNEFRPEVWERRVAASPGLVWQSAKATQLAKAERLLERVRHAEGLVADL